jgi:hypothetical protein
LGFKLVFRCGAALFIVYVNAAVTRIIRGSAGMASIEEDEDPQV